ncbi:hypothetical protein CCP3SC1AL1_1690004 [Gammaproteobacteria bacterium]
MKRVENRKDGKWLIIGEHEMPICRFGGRWTLADAPYSLILSIGQEQAFEEVEKAIRELC